MSDPTTNPNATPPAKLVAARALIDFELPPAKANGDPIKVKSGDLCRVPPEIAEAMKDQGAIDTHPDAVAYAGKMASAQAQLERAQATLEAATAAADK